jgi:two-component system response regulator YesN
MYRILLVDDEPRQLRALSAIVQSLRPEYEVHTATDGSEAWTLAQTLGFDVVISDIRMPVMDGLQLLERVSELPSPCKFALLSGFGEFVYAQQAIKLGIFDYIVKPIGRAEIEQLLTKIDSALDHEQLTSNQIGELARQLDDSLPAYREKLLLQWLHGYSDYAEIKTMVQKQLQSECGFVLITKIASDKLATLERERVIAERYQSTVRDMLTALVPSVFLTMKEEGRLVSLAICRDMNSGLWKKALRQLQQAQSEIGMEFGATLSSGCSLPSANIWLNGSDTYRQASQALEKSFYAGLGQVLVFEQSTSEHPEPPDLFEREQHFADAVCSGQAEAAHMWLNQLFDRIKDNGHLQPAQIKSDVAKLIMDRLREARHLAAEDEYGALAERIRGKLLLCEDYRELRHWAKKLLTPVFELYQRTSKDKNSLIIQQCREYIKDHCQDEITLEALAHMFHFNASYFSTLFKSQTNISLTDYILQVRMEKAQQLLMETNEKISSIARKVGYKESTYFIRLFRREKGISPKKYRSLSGKR